MEVEIAVRRRIFPDSRIYTPIFDYLVLFEAIMRSVESFRVPPKTTFSNEFARVNCLRFDHALALPLWGPLEHAIAEKPFPGIVIGKMDNLRDSPFPAGSLTTNGFATVIRHTMIATYLAYFERYNEWLTANLGKKAHLTWPPTLNFARVIRNAAAHGSINIRDAATPPVHWRGLSYDHASSGNSIIGADMTNGDMLELIFDTSDELDKLGVPIL